jgi:hypothetical protein
MKHSVGSARGGGAGPRPLVLGRIFEPKMHADKKRSKRCPIKFLAYGLE